MKLNLLNHISRKLKDGEEVLSILRDLDDIPIRGERLSYGDKEVELDMYEIGGIYYIYCPGDFNSDELYSSEDISKEIFSIIELGLFSDRLVKHLKEYFSVFTIHNKTNLPVLRDISVKNTSKELTLKEVEKKQGYNYADKLKELLLMDNGLPFSPLSFQEKFLKMKKRYNFWVTGRRAGKTITMVYIAFRELFKKNKTILYVAPNSSYNVQPLIYVKRFLQLIKETGDTSIKFNPSVPEIRNDETNSVVKFLSAEMKHGIRSFTADVVIFDEAAFIDDDEFDNIIPIIEQSQGDFYAVTTIKKETPKNWFYKEFMKGELGLDDEFYSLRVPCYDNPLFTDKSIERIKHTMDEETFRCEMLGEFGDTSEVFKKDKFFNLDIEFDNIRIHGVGFKGKPSTENGKYIIGYDPAKKVDGSGVSVWSLKEGKVISSFYISQGYDYLKQVEFIMKLREYYNSATVVLDETGVGAVVHDLFGPYGYNPVKVHYITSLGTMNYNGERGIDYVPKTDLVNFLSVDIAKGYISGTGYLGELKTEFDGFEGTPKKNYIEYSAKSGFKDDLVNSVMILNYYRRQVYPDFTRQETNSIKETKINYRDILKGMNGGRKSRKRYSY